VYRLTVKRNYNTYVPLVVPMVSLRTMSAMTVDAGQAAAERALTAVRTAWADALGTDAIAPDDDFFMLGGHSLLILEVVDAVEEATGVEIPLRLFFEQPRVEPLAEYVAANC
jgi:acyl carrier protein